MTLTVLCAGAVVPMAYAAAPASGTQPDPGPLARYLARVEAPLTVHHDERGVVDYVASRAAGVIPLGADVSPGRAARTQLDRLGGVLDTAGRTLRASATRPSIDGGSVTRFRQYVGGLPVLGGEAVVGVDRHGGLSSASTALSRATSAAADPLRRVIGALKARQEARDVVARAHPHAGHLRVHDQGSWLYDDALVSGPSVGRTQVYRLQVGNGSDVLETVLVDAETGRVLMHFSDIDELDRTVCDLNDTRASTSFACTGASPQRVRSEGQAASGRQDADATYDLLKAVSDFYARLGIDLTDTIGVQDGSKKTIAATVRYCDGSGSCPMQNAYWNGTEMYIGDGYASDDVIGHELTHGVISGTADLFYYRESGAINESLADTMGEIFDHQHPSSDDPPGDWHIGEGLPIGSVRSMSDPPAYNQPDRMTSTLWDADTDYGDNGGVHTNSGVGNKTAYLIANGGTFNGHTVTGIDTGDPNLTKTAALYLYVIEHLVSGSQYADLARALGQGCDALAAAGTDAITSANCAEVREATTATELEKTPIVAGATRPAEAPSTCPAGSARRTIARPGLTPDNSGLWHASPGPGMPVNGRDDDGDYYAYDPDPTYDATMHGSLTSEQVEIPAGQKTYLWYSQWYQYEWYQDANGTYDWDGQQVEVNEGDGWQVPPASAWVNGPSSALLLDDPSHPVTGFGGDSNGWISSRLDLTSHAGKTVSVDWRTRGDSTQGSFFGAFVDQVAVYTCDPQPLDGTAAPKVSGTAQVGQKLSATSGTWSPAPTSVRYQWLRNGAAISGATASSYTIAPADLSKRLSVTVTAATADSKPTTATSAQTAVVKAGALTSVVPKVSGTATVGKTLTAVPGTWKPAGVALTYQWLRSGAAIKGATKKTYTLAKADKGKKISVRVTGKKTGYTTKTVTSSATGAVK